MNDGPDANVERERREGPEARARKFSKSRGLLLTFPNFQHIPFIFLHISSYSLHISLYLHISSYSVHTPSFFGIFHVIFSGLQRIQNIKFSRPPSYPSWERNIRENVHSGRCLIIFEAPTPSTPGNLDFLKFRRKFIFPGYDFSSFFGCKKYVENMKKYEEISGKYEKICRKKLEKLLVLHLYIGSRTWKLEISSIIC